MQSGVTQTEIIIVSDRAALAREAAQRFVSLAQQAIAACGRFSVALSGGSTPCDLYVLLATSEFAAQIDWTRAHFFWGDERAVPPDHRGDLGHPDSNYRMARETLLSRVPVPQQNVHRILAEQNPADAARAYEQTLREFFGSDDRVLSGTKQSGVKSKDAWPRFDLILLGLGEDGHTASLFPHTRVLRETERWVAAEYVMEVKAHRITLTAPVINAAENILLVVAGAEKAATVRAVLRGDYCPDDLPAQLIEPTDGRVVWLLDRETASRL